MFEDDWWSVIKFPEKFFEHEERLKHWGISKILGRFSRILNQQNTLESRNPATEILGILWKSDLNKHYC